MLSIYPMLEAGNNSKISGSPPYGNSGGKYSGPGTILAWQRRAIVAAVGGRKEGDGIGKQKSHICCEFRVNANPSFEWN